MGRRLGRIVRVAALAEMGRTDADLPATAPFRRNTMGAHIRAILRRDIIEGRLPPRAMLSEQDIAASFGVSRTPVREATIKLAEEGLIEIFPQYGSFVAPIKLGAVFASQFAREALECAAVERAIERLDDIQDARLKAVINRQRTLLQPRDRDAFFRADEDLHMLILKIAGQGTAWHFVESAKVQMDRVRHIAIRLPRKQASILAEHVAVVDRLFARDRAGAVDAMRVHLRGIFRTIKMLRAEKNEYFVDDQEKPWSETAASPAIRETRKYAKAKSH